MWSTLIFIDLLLHYQQIVLKKSGKNTLLLNKLKSLNEYDLTKIYRIIQKIRLNKTLGIKSDVFR